MIRPFVKSLFRTTGESYTPGGFSGQICESIWSEPPGHRPASPHALTQNFDRKSSRSLKIKRPRPMHPSRLRHLVPILAQTLVDLVNPRLTLLDEPHMKARWIPHL